MYEWVFFLVCGWLVLHLFKMSFFLENEEEDELNSRIFCVIRLVGHSYSWLYRSRVWLCASSCRYQDSFGTCVRCTSFWRVWKQKHWTLHFNQLLAFSVHIFVFCCLIVSCAPPPLPPFPPHPSTYPFPPSHFCPPGPPSLPIHSGPGFPPLSLEWWTLVYPLAYREKNEVLCACYC